MILMLQWNSVLRTSQTLYFCHLKAVPILVNVCFITITIYIIENWSALILLTERVQCIIFFAPYALIVFFPCAVSDCYWRTNISNQFVSQIAFHAVTCLWVIVRTIRDQILLFTEYINLEVKVIFITERASVFFSSWISNTMRNFLMLHTFVLNNVETIFTFLTNSIRLSINSTVGHFSYNTY